MRRETAEADLRWYLRDARGELGLHSNYGGMVATLQGGGRSGDHHRVDLRQMEAAARARRIEKALTHVGKEHLRVLYAAYSVDPDQRFVAVLAVLPEALEEHRRSRSTRSFGNWLARLFASARKGHDYGRRRLFAKLHSAADGTLRGALDAYTGQQNRDDEGGVLVDRIG